MIGTRITKDLGDNKYEVVIDPVDTNTDPTVIGVAHDYVLFSSWTTIATEPPLMLKSPSGGGVNTLPIKNTVQIPIKMMGQVVMPYLSNHPYLKKDHYKDYGIYQPDAPVITWEKDIVYVYDKEQHKYVSMSKTLYEQLKS